jgi:hypothetical protein
MIDVEEVLPLLMWDYINKKVLMPHDIAREAYKARAMRVPDYREFKEQIEAYIRYHHQAVGEGTPSPEMAFAEAKRILDGVFGEDPFQEGYTVALQQAVTGEEGGMRAILNVLADQLKRQALNSYKDWIFEMYVDRLESQAESEALAHAYFKKFGAMIRPNVPGLTEKAWASNVRAGLEYHLRVVETIERNARKI